MGFEIKDLTDEQKAKMKVRHYTLHLPATMTQEQYQFISNIAQWVLDNQPVTVVHEKSMQFLLRIVYSYRSILKEFDEQDRWTDQDESDLNNIVRGFQPILEYLVEEFKIDIGKFRRD